ncbi:MAG: aquaporin [Acidobacteriota bacterium]
MRRPGVERPHWPEYLIEAAALGVFMISACVFTVLLEHPASPIHLAIDDVFQRRVLMGLAMGLTASAIIQSPWGHRSGAHMNPALTFTFWTLGKISARDAFFYVLFQFAGGLAGVLLSAIVIGPPLWHSAVNFAPTIPGMPGEAAAFWSEAAISALLMATALIVSSSATLRPWMPVFAGLLVGSFIVFESPLSGMSMNPTRTLASAIPSGEWNAIWIYFTAPPLGMLATAQVYRLVSSRQKV